jgi:DNA-directed RNA polymerase subunit omega
VVYRVVSPGYKNDPANLSRGYIFHESIKLYEVNSDHYDPAPGAASAYDTPLGITNPPIDELLDRVSSKYALVIYAAKRARQINDYYNQLGDGILEYVGPLVEPGLQEKPLSLALREIHGDLLEHTEGE